jgi:hypothetical protein
MTYVKSVLSFCQEKYFTKTNPLPGLFMPYSMITSVPEDFDTLNFMVARIMIGKYDSGKSSVD